MSLRKRPAVQYGGVAVITFVAAAAVIDPYLLTDPLGFLLESPDRRFARRATSDDDPKGHKARLQGEWVSVEPDGRPGGKYAHYLSFSGDRLLSKSLVPSTDGKVECDHYRFVVCSQMKPGVIRYVERFGVGRPGPGMAAPQASHYWWEGQYLYIKHWASSFDDGSATRYTRYKHE